MSNEEQRTDQVEKDQDSVITMKQLLEAGVHFGHQSSQWNPAMKEYIYGSRNGIHIIDLQKTLKSFLVAYDFVRDLTSTGKDILFVGTKKQAQEIIGEEAIKCDMPFVNSRWLGGTLTNFNTIRSRVDYMLQLKRLKDEGEFENLPKKEQISLNRELAKLEYEVYGISRSEPKDDYSFNFIKCDISNSDSVKEIFAKFRRDKNVYALINVAGVASMNLLISTPEETIRKIINLKLF